jgi:hypothetical protein
LQPSGFVSNRGFELPDLVDGYRELRALLEILDPKARDTLRRVLVHDQADRDAIASPLMRYQEENGWADIIDLLSMYPDVRRRVVRGSVS